MLSVKISVFVMKILIKNNHIRTYPRTSRSLQNKFYVAVFILDFWNIEKKAVVRHRNLWLPIVEAHQAEIVALWTTQKFGYFYIFFIGYF